MYVEIYLFYWKLIQDSFHSKLLWARLLYHFADGGRLEMILQIEAVKARKMKENLILNVVLKY